MSNALESQGAVFSIEGATTGTYVEIGEVKDWNAFGGSASVIDVTHLGSVAKEKRMGLQDFGQFTANFNHIPSDAGQLLLEAAKASREIKNFKLELDDGTVYKFAGFVLSKPITGAVDGIVGGSVTVEISGDVTVEV